MMFQHPYFVGVCMGTALGIITSAWILYWYHLEIRKMQDRVYRTKLEAVRNDFQKRFQSWTDHNEALEKLAEKDGQKIIQLERRVAEALEYLQSVNGPNRAIVMLQSIMDGNLAPYRSEYDVRKNFASLQDAMKVVEQEAGYDETESIGPVTIVTDPNVIDGYDAEPCNA